MPISEKIKYLKYRLSRVSTYELLLAIKRKNVNFGNSPEEIAANSNPLIKTVLFAPEKQWCYLIALLMSTNAKNTKPQKNGFLEKFEEKIARITNTYLSDFFGVCSADEFKKQNVENRIKAQICIEAFDAYYFQAPLRSIEQTRKLIIDLYGKYQDEFEKIRGLSFDTLFNFFEFISKKEQESFENPLSSLEDTFCFYEKVIYGINNDSNNEFSYNVFESGDLPDDKKSILKKKIHDTFDLMKKTFIVTVDEIKNAFPDDYKTLINLFCLERSERDFLYFDEKNPFLEKPLCFIDKEKIFIMGNHYLMNGIYNLISSTLENNLDKIREKVLKNKSDQVENRFCDCFFKIFGSKCKIHRNVCEKEKDKEHDILVEIDDFIIIAEVKSGKFKAPFRDKEKGFERIKRDFNNNGIGYAYTQAIKLKKHLDKNEEIILYEDMKNPFKIKASGKQILICLFSLEQYGALTINLNGFLKKEENDPFPWVCNLCDFETIVELCEYLKTDYKKFLEYLCFRVRAHKNILACDEIDIIEPFLLNKDFPKDNNDCLIFEANYNNYVTKIFYEKLGVPYKYNGTTIKKYDDKKGTENLNAFLKNQILK